MVPNGEQTMRVKGGDLRDRDALSAEYAARDYTENTVGRLTEWWRGPNATPEDITRALSTGLCESSKPALSEFPSEKSCAGLAATPSGPERGAALRAQVRAFGRVGAKAGWRG